MPALQAMYALYRIRFCANFSFFSVRVLSMGSEQAKALGIDDTLQKLSKMSGGREVNAMIFKDPQSAKAKAPSTRIPGRCGC